MKLTINLVVVLFLSTGPSPSQGVPVDINGHVAGENVPHLSGAVVRLVPASMIGLDVKSMTSIAATVGKDGQLKLGNVKPGTYNICVVAVNHEVLNPCEWRSAARTVNVAEGKTAPDLNLVLPTGTTLRVRVEDPEKLVSTIFRPVKGSNLEIGVWTQDGDFHRARYVSSGEGGHDYELVIPLDTDLKLSVGAAGMEVFDAKGSRVDGVKPAVIRADRGKAAPKFTYRVAAPK